MSNSFLADMQTIVTGQVESLTRYDIDGSKGGSIWVSKPNTGKNPDVLGRELIKIKMPYVMFDQLEAKEKAGELTFPTRMEVLCDIDMGGGNKAVLVATSIKKVVEEKVEENLLPEVPVKPGASKTSVAATPSTTEKK